MKKTGILKIIGLILIISGIMICIINLLGFFLVLAGIVLSVGNEVKYGLAKDNKTFLEEKPLELSFEKGPEADKMRKIIKDANQHYVVLHTETETKSYVNFYIHVPTTTFANAYYHLGIMVQEQLLSKRKSAILKTTAKTET